MRKIQILIFPALLCLVAICVLVQSCKKNDSAPPAPATLSISSISPKSDTIGARIVITGSNFSTNPADNIVKLNDEVAEVISATPTQLTIIVPNSAYSGKITVTINGKTATSSDTFTIPSFSITGFSPGIIGIGYPLMITGTSFSADAATNKVTINGVPATVSYASNNLLTAIVPMGATTGQIGITVKGPYTTSLNNVIVKNLTVTTMGVFGNTTSLPLWTIASDASGNYYFGDSDSGRVRKISASGVLSTVAGTGVLGNADGPVATATLGTVHGIALDSHGNIFVTTLGYNTIREISTTGVVSTFAGDPNGSSGSVDGTGTAARFNLPVGIVLDKSDNVFVTDAGTNKIRKITPAGVVTTVAGSGATGSADGTGAAASFNGAWGIGIDANDNLYVCDVQNYKIRKVTPAGVVTTFAGDGTIGVTDGPALSARFNGAQGIVQDKSGNFYVTDGGSNKIRMISPDGQVYTLAGNLTNSSIDGSGNFASFSSPLGITIDPSGVMAVVDRGTQKIRKIVVQ
ncbi:MAG TPA: IPT/TIG domain-containing protein [Puia sp.]|nr:IPT/TIG domain-containing protein [Puia sp.]